MYLIYFFDKFRDFKDLCDRWNIDYSEILDEYNDIKYKITGYVFDSLVNIKILMIKEDSEIREDLSKIFFNLNNFLSNDLNNFSIKLENFSYKISSNYYFWQKIYESPSIYIDKYTPPLFEEKENLGELYINLKKFYLSL